MDTFWEFALFYCAPVSSCITSLLDMAFNVNWFIKITRSLGSGFQKQQIAKPNVRLIIIESRSKQRFISDQIGNSLVCETMTHCFFCYVNIMLIVFFMSVELYGLDLPGTWILLLYSYWDSYAERGTYYLVVGCQYGPCWPMDLFPFQHPLSREITSDWVENSIGPVRLVSLPRCAELRFRLTVRSTLGKSSQP